MVPVHDLYSGPAAHGHDGLLLSMLIHEERGLSIFRLFSVVPPCNGD